MRFISFQSGGQLSYGLLHEDGFVLDLPVAAKSMGWSAPATLLDLISSEEDLLGKCKDALLKAPSVSLRNKDQVRLLAPLPRPARLRDASLFLEHMKASLAKIGQTINQVFYDQVIYYNGNHTAIFGPGDDIAWPDGSAWMDYELELAVVIGKSGFRIKEHDARDHIFGLTIFNDWSARDLQIEFMKAGIGPCGGKDFANSVGPCIVTLDELPDIYNLTMTARVNGEVWSRGISGSIYHRFERAVSELSALSPLVPGEIIGSGTVVKGCGFELDRRLSKGDQVELEVEGIGILKNTLA